MTDPRIEAAAWMIGSVSDLAPGGDWEKLAPHQKTHFRRLAKAVLDAADAAAWRPMSEAPRDGTVINVLLPEGISKADQDFYCYPGSRVSFGWAWENSKFRPCAGLTVFIQPTHWQPLPAPPKDEVKA